VQRASDKAVFKTQLQVAPPVPRFASVWAPVALPPLAVLLFPGTMSCGGRGATSRNCRRRLMWWDVRAVEVPERFMSELNLQELRTLGGWRATERFDCRIYALSPQCARREQICRESCPFSWGAGLCPCSRFGYWESAVVHASSCSLISASSEIARMGQHPCF